MDIVKDVINPTKHSRIYLAAAHILIYEQDDEYKSEVTDRTSTVIH